MKRPVIASIALLFLSCLTLRAENYPYRSDLLWTTTPDHPDWLYEVNEEPTVQIGLLRYGIPLQDLAIRYRIGPELMPADTEGTLKLENGQATLAIGTMKVPGFRDLVLETEIEGKSYQHHIKLGFSPERLSPYTQLPSDFQDFWQSAKQEAEKCPMTVERTFVPEYSSDLLDCYLVKIQAYQKGNYVYGYLTIPKRKGKFPAVFSPPGAGIKPMNPTKDLFYAENGFIRLDLEIHGIRPDLDKETYAEISNAFGKGNTSYLVNGLDDRDNYYLKKVYLSCLRAIDILATLPEWDGRNLIAQGGSQGGALALIATSLDKRITVCAANHPALSDMAGYKAGRAGGYPHLFTKFEGMDTPAKLATLPYYDVVNFARFIDVPAFMTWGFNDNTCPPTTSYIVYNTLSCEKEALITPLTEHWISLDTRHRIMKWIQSKLR